MAIISSAYKTLHLIISMLGWGIEEIFHCEALLTPHRPVKYGNYSVVVDCYMTSIM